VYLVGTAHVSRQSAEDVRRVIRALRPQNVVVELCSSRTAVMFDAAGIGDNGHNGCRGQSGVEIGAAAAGHWRAGSDASTGAASGVTEHDNTAQAAAARQASVSGVSGSGRQGLASNLLALR
jgi:hypothetical protein